MRATSALAAAAIIGLAWIVMALARGMDALIGRIKK